MPIPPELIYEIIDILAEDKQTLSSLSLAHRSLLHPCRTRLFRSIRLSKPEKGSSSNAILTLLHTSPYLTAYIHHLHVHDHAGPNQIHWLHTDVCVAKLLSAVTLTKLNVEFTGRTVLWSLLSPGLKTALSATLRSPQLAEVGMTGIHGFPGHLLCNPALKRLSLCAMWIPPPSTPSPTAEKKRRFSLFSSGSAGVGTGTSAPTKPRLASLSIAGDGAGSWVLEESGIDLSELKSFEIHPRYPSEVERAKEVLDRARESIREFTWCGSENLDCPVSPLSIDLSTLPALRVVNFHETLYWDDSTCEPPEHYLQECIEFLKSGKGSHIRDISMNFNCAFWSDLPEGVLRFLCEDPLWTALAGLLSDMRYFSNLDSVRVEVTTRAQSCVSLTEKGVFDEVGDVEACLRRTLGVLEGAGRKLDVCISYEPAPTY